MSDIQKIEQAIRRVREFIARQPHETGIESVLQLLADELTEDKNLAAQAADFKAKYPGYKPHKD